jgi:hypothetical protein
VIGVKDLYGREACFDEIERQIIAFELGYVRAARDSSEPCYSPNSLRGANFVPGHKRRPAV